MVESATIETLPPLRKKGGSRKVPGWVIGGVHVYADRKGMEVHLHTPQGQRLRLKCFSVSAAKQLIRTLGELSVIAAQFDHHYPDGREVARRAIDMVQAARWFANRKNRTFGR